ncbi:Cytosol aminopeptidase [Dictyocoela muelleri]|nr:Cytosol aminopeptidase [Dictyocoela muelleri]
MVLLNWKKIFENQKKAGKTGKIVFYTKETHYITYPENEEWSNFLKDTNADATDVRILPSDEILFFVGVKSMTHPHLKRGAAQLVPNIKSYGILNISFDHFENESFKQSAIEGLVLAAYTYDFLKLSFNNEVMKKTEKIFVDGDTFKYECQNFARFLADTPANLMTPSLFSEYAKEYMNFCGLDSIKVLGRKQIEDLKMNLFLSVSNGSKEEPKLVHIQYRGADYDTLDLALIGKGITFDSGGISLKPSGNMRDMKADMMGAASVLAAVGFAVRSKMKINVDVVIPLTENMPSGSATKPGDVHISMSGKSVEIENTDAEGRLILADAITYAQINKPKRIIDVATLTGAIRIALGTVNSGLFSNNDEFAKIIIKASQVSDDPCWMLPICEEYKKDLNSSVADLQNTGGPGAGSIKAALFLKQFVEVDWAHIDIAGVMNNSHDSALYGKNMTGRPVALLIEVMNMIKS